MQLSYGIPLHMNQAFTYSPQYYPCVSIGKILFDSIDTEIDAVWHRKLPIYLFIYFFLCVLSSAVGQEFQFLMASHEKIETLLIFYE